MSGRDGVELDLDEIAGVLLVVGCGATLGGFDATVLGIAAPALLVVVVVAATKWRPSR